MSEHPESKKGRRRLFIPIKDNNAGKEASVATISRWICTTIVDIHAATQKSKRISRIVKALCSSATLLQLFNKVDLQTVMKARRWSSRGTFTSFYLRDLCPQADHIHVYKTGPVVAAEEIIVISFWVSPSYFIFNML